MCLENSVHMKSRVSACIKGAVKSSLVSPALKLMLPPTHCLMNCPSRGILGSQNAHLPVGKSGLAATNAYKNVSQPQVHSSIIVSSNATSHDCIVPESSAQW